MKTPFKYYINHLVIGLIIDFSFILISLNLYKLPLDGFFYGAIFYSLREIFQAAKKGYIDWKGFSPIIGSTILYLIKLI